MTDLMLRTMHLERWKVQSERSEPQRDGLAARLGNSLLHCFASLGSYLKGIGEVDWYFCFWDFDVRLMAVASG
jgi:hypothetical protein